MVPSLRSTNNATGTGVTTVTCVSNSWRNSSLLNLSRLLATDRWCVKSELAGHRTPGVSLAQSSLALLSESSAVPQNRNGDFHILTSTSLSVVSFIAPFIVSVTPSLGRSLGEGLLYPRLALGAAARLSPSADQLIFNLARPCVRASVGPAGRTRPNYRPLVTPRNLVCSNWVIMRLTSLIILVTRDVQKS